MAGGWIKIEKRTPDKPEIRYISRSCECTKEKAFLAWFELWSYFDDNIDETGFLRLFTLEDCDDVAELSGIGRALQRAEWLTVDSLGLTVNKWNRHNGRSAKQRAMTARRVTDFRAHKKPCNGDVTIV